MPSSRRLRSGPGLTTWDRTLYRTRKSVPATPARVLLSRRMSGSAFDHPRIASLYDALDPDRSDLDFYLQLLEEIGARSVVDIGCGTGVFALLLAAKGIDVVGVDPAGAMLDVARAKPGAEKVRWVHGYAADLPPMEVDAVTMTANTAQVFVTDVDWEETLAVCHRISRPGGSLLFETRGPAPRPWESWAAYRGTTEVEGVGPVTEWYEIVEVTDGLVTFDAHNLLPDGEDVVARSTLRFRSREELDRSLAAAGFEVVAIHDPPDRPGLEWLYHARKV